MELMRFLRKNTGSMQIKSSRTNSSGKVFDAVYQDIEDPVELEGKNIRAVHGYCFYGGKLLVVWSDKKGSWTPAGGSVEAGESFEDAVIREVTEEANMRVIKQQIIGSVDYFSDGGYVETQTRSVCLVEPHGPFVSDPDGDIDKIELIEPSEFEKYFDWGEIGAHVMKKALELKAEMEK